MLNRLSALAMGTLLVLGIVTTLAQPANAHDDNDRWYRRGWGNRAVVNQAPCNQGHNGWQANRSRYTPREAAYLANLRKRYLADGDLSRRERRNLEQARLRALSNQNRWY